MKCILGNKIIELNREETQGFAGNFSSTIIDLGTGDGRFVYENALRNPKNFYIGIDPAEKQLLIYSKKSVRKNLNNSLFVVGSIEVFPVELYKLADEIYINLPWGSLLEKIINPDDLLFDLFNKLLKTGGKINILFGYVPELEPGLTKKLNLPEIDKEYVQDILLSKYKKNGYETVSFEQLNRETIKKNNTTWSKKLTFGNNRPIYKICLIIK